ncbi:MAG TPA: C4-type zinc ribbon domain-containing protein [Opitutaceae bacterium]|jgi:uncharacterized protein|nr:hypothetical protein [Opitutaceae bacterium]OQB97527.1 MAG: putative zinc ribbon domain protein [Verrucomicrobia bacterium ADurb.Bin122]MBP8961915.1 hypothetical protein [Opitutaceae bacterium]HNW41493.1 C4-type zinc ribbon domain-containing protein [Opitutaceae bacterium]HOD46604.1 C4-type zinc ribbon domain-containing protein [Opitutaceae bacterium]
MQPPSLAPLLILQDRDRRRRDLDQQIQANPKDIAAVEARINAEKNAIETARTELKELETKKKLIEGEITATEQKAAKYRTQQLEVRKNDEYRAIGNEIEHLVKQIEGLEEQELAVMYAIDEAKKKFAAAEAVLKQNIAGYEQRLRDLRARDGVLRAELATAEADFQAARPAVPEAALRLYDRVAAQRFPACVPTHDGKCGGCHLKISGEIESAIRGKAAELATCDQCGRIVWWES